MRLGGSPYRLRLIVGFTLVIVLIALAWAWSLYGPLDRAVREQQESRLEDIARAGALLIPAGDRPVDETITGLAADSGVRITVIAEDGTVLADTQEDPSVMENHADRPEVATALDGLTGTDVRHSETQGVERMYVAVPATTAEGEAIVVRASESLESIAALSSEARRSGMLLLPVVLVLASAAAWAITRSAARPIEHLADSARAIAAGDLSVRIPEESATLRPLSEALVSLREQLRERLNALEAGQRTLRLALDGLADGVVVLDGDRISLTNRALGVQFRIPPGDHAGTALAELGLPAPIEAAIETRITEEDSSAVDLGPDPFQRYHRVVVVPLGGESRSRTLVVISDETDRMRLDAVRRDFVTNASHELKTPVAGILLLAESAANAQADGDTVQSEAFLRQIREEASRLQRLVAELLDLSRLETTPHTGEIADVRRAIELALAAHRRAAAAQGLSLAADLDAVAGQDVAARIGATDLAVALDNLLSNAIAYTETGAVMVRLAADSTSVIIEVTDTGIGIPDEDVERVFERFYRVDRARSRTSGGTGLGLALVRNMVERAGGSVGIVSLLGQGTTATIRLPRAN